MTALDLSVLPDPLSLCRLPANVPPPNWALAGDGFLVYARAAGELSVIVATAAVPERVPSDDGWRALRVDTPLEPTMTGVLLSLAAPLADAGIPILAVSTHDTDYVLVKEDDVERAAEALTAAGHRLPLPDVGSRAPSDDDAR